MKTNREVIGLDLGLKPQKYVGEYIGIENFSPELMRIRGLQNDLVVSVESAIYRHLGFRDDRVKLVSLADGVATGVNLFFGDWWQYPPDNYESESEKNDEILWYKPMHFSLFLASLLQQWEKLRKIASWCFDDNADQYFGPIGEEEPFVVLLFAEHFGGKQLGRSAELRSQIEACRRKRPKLLLMMLDALIAKDQDLFQGALEQLLTRFSKSCPRADVGNLWQVVDVITSTFRNVGVHLVGLEDRELSSNLKAHLVTPDSVY